MTPAEAVQILKSIWRNHPFFNSGGGAFGYDFPTFRVCYPRSAAIYRAVAAVARKEAV